MTTCLLAAIDAAHAGEKHAAQLGMDLRFSSEDVRCLANTIYINHAGGK